MAWLILVMLVSGVLGFITEVGFLVKQSPQIGASTKWLFFAYAMIFFLAIFHAIGIYGGVALLRGQDWSVVRLVRAILWVSGPLAVIVYAVILPRAAFGELDARAAVPFFGEFMMSVLGAGIWTAYLSVSKRVRNTYDYAGFLNAPDQEGTTRLMIAAMLGKDKKVSELIAAGADIDAADERGRTALMFAASRNEIEVVKLLLKLGANASLQNEGHKTAVDIANDHDNREVSELLESGISLGI